MSNKTEVIHSKIWHEVAEDDNPFAAASCHCSGYDVYSELLGKASWIEYLYLLFIGERPSTAQAVLLEGLAFTLANPGPRDHSVRAAMNAGVGGSTYASCLMAGIAVGAGQLGGAHEVAIAMNYWQQCGTDLAKWQEQLAQPPNEERADIWEPIEHPPGFDPNGMTCPTPVRQVLRYLAKISPGPALPWLQCNRRNLEDTTKYPLAISGIAAAAFIDLGFEPRQSEMLFLLLRLPGAAVHALEQEQFGWRKFPFFTDAIKLENDPEANTNVDKNTEVEDETGNTTVRA